MDAVEYLNECGRMCDYYKDCVACPALGSNHVCMVDFVSDISPEEAVSVVEKWSKENPVKTRQSEFLKQFPNAVMFEGTIGINPCCLNTNMNSVCMYRKSCHECTKKYWSKEIE